jgi:hypothetical protein
LRIKLRMLSIPPELLSHIKTSPGWCFVSLQTLSSGHPT